MAALCDNRSLLAARGLCSAAGLWAWTNSDHVQEWIDAMWNYLKESAIYRSVVFETIYTIELASVLMLAFWAMERVPAILRRYTNRKKPVSMPGPLTLAVMAGRHFSLFGPLDFITPKRYGHVDPAAYAKRQGYVHLTRLLPNRPPTVAELLYETIVALVIYDALFFAFHLLCHKVPYLWKTIHRHHHDQTELSAYETHHLHAVEHLMLVLLGNESLRMVGAHPMSRTLFNSWLVYFLFANHSAIDLPLSIDKIVPFGLMHGPAEHASHHLQNLTKNYQPIFSYFDRLLEWLERRKKRTKALQSGCGSVCDEPASSPRRRDHS